jgi:hypothetical protein
LPLLVDEMTASVNVAEYASARVTILLERGGSDPVLEEVDFWMLTIKYLALSQELPRSHTSNICFEYSLV